MAPFFTLTIMILLLKKLDYGKRKQCDGRCYRSKGPGSACKCICKGANHGIGLKEAIERTIINRASYEVVGIVVTVEDRLLFDVDPAKVKRLRFKKRLENTDMPLMLKFKKRGYNE